MARLIAETPVLSGSDARRFEEAISNVQPLSSERRAEMDAEYRSFTSKVIINIWLLMQLDRLTAESVIMPFDCGDDDLNAFRFITVDAYLSAIPFYEKNDFRL